ncbi:MAG: NTPase KAP, partial [Curvibacter sp.]|nr:NTPase KAP [Curvibacter sp.]
MSLKDTKVQLARLIGDPEIKVLALSGKWGTGKTHLWSEVRQSSKDDKVKSAIYASLFGLSSVDQIKRKLLGEIVPQIESDAWGWASLRHVFKLGV